MFTLVNPDYQRIANKRALLGQPMRAAWPELVGHGALDVLDRVCTDLPARYFPALNS